MNRNALKYLFFTLMLFVSLTSFAGSVKKGFTALEMHDYFKAKKSFTKGMKYNPEICSFGLATLYTRDNNVFYSRDSALRYVLIAKANYGGAKDSKKKKWVKYGWTITGIDSLERLIADQFFAEAKRINTPGSYNSFLQSHPNSVHSSRALIVRDSIAFFSAVMTNTSSSYQNFMASYPQSEYTSIAEENYYQVQFSELTGDGTLASYVEFVAINANSPLRPAAERKIFEIVTKPNTRAAYDVFIRTYPNNSMVDSAWRQLYQSSLDTFNILTLKRFKSRYQNYPYPKEILRDMEFMDSLFLPMKTLNGFGFMNTAGIEMIPPMYEQVSKFSDGLAVVAKNGKYGVIDKYNHVRVPFKFDAISDFIFGRAIVEQDGLQGMMHRNGSFVLECKFGDMGTLSNGLIFASDGEKFGYYDVTGFLRIPMKFDDAYDFANGVAKVAVDGLVAFIDIYGGYVVPPAFEEVRTFSDSLYVYELDGMYGFTNRLGKAVTDPIYDDVGELREGFAIASMDGEVVYLNEAGQVVIQNDLEEFPNFMSKAEFMNGEAIAMQNGLYGKIDQKGRVVLKFQYENLGKGAYAFPFKKNNQWGVMNSAGKVIINPMYVSVAIHDDTYVIAKTELGEGVLGMTAALIIPLTFKSIEYIAGDLFIVETATGFGILRKETPVTPLEYSSVQRFGKDFLLLSNADRWSYFDLTSGQLIEIKTETGE